MRISKIIFKSVTLPFREYRLFIVVLLLAVICELISREFYSLHIGQLSLLLMVLNSIITLIILGLMLNLSENAVFNNEVDFNIHEKFMEGIKEYLVGLYYLLLSFVLSSFFIIPTGVYSNLVHIKDYILKMDLNTTFLTIHKLSHELPVSLNLNLHHALQLNLVIAIVIFITLMSFSFISKLILIKHQDIKRALNIVNVFSIIKNIGYWRYLKFLTAISIVLILLFNTIILLEFMFGDIIVSAFLESFVLFFSMSAFSLICTSQ